MSDDDLLHLGIHEVIRRLRRSDSEKMQLMMDHSNMMKDVNQKLQMHLKEIRSLKEVNQRLQAEKHELKDLCCFLDDDREKGRKLAREWQRFGKYTSDVMNHEVMNYKQQLAELEEKQKALGQDQERLVKENAELKELCVFLDQERARLAQPPGERDDGDGCSSSTTQNGEESSPSSSSSIQPQGDAEAASSSTMVPGSPGILTSHGQGPRDTTSMHSPGRTLHGHQRASQAHTLSPVDASMKGQPSTISADTFRYIRQLESRVRHLEKEMVLMSQSHTEVDNTTSSTQQPRKYFSTPLLSTFSNKQEDAAPPKPRRLLPPPADMSHHTVTKPESVGKALKILEVQDQVENGYYGDGVVMGDAERDLLQGMCDMVWMKLGVEKGGHRDEGTPM